VYQIGLFSRINHITTKTLRHYDEIGLLKPDHVDSLTGYRYYTSEQLPKLHRILALRKIGLSLNEIKVIIEQPETVEVFLKMKTRELREEADAIERKQKEIESWIKHLNGDNTMEYTPLIKSLPAVIVASMRTRLPSYNTYFEIMPQMGEEMGRQGAVTQKDPEYCFTIYHDGEYKEEDIDVEVCEAVVKACEDSDMVQYKRVEKVEKAACVLHKGPYSTIRNAYAFLYTWIKENNYEPAGLPRESYIDGIWNKEDEEEWLTELQVPIKSV